MGGSVWVRSCKGALPHLARLKCRHAPQRAQNRNKKRQSHVLWELYIYIYIYIYILYIYPIYIEIYIDI
jgi:hypothetical protein